MDLGLKNKAVIVCASSSGLGKAIALEFAREGANVMLASSNEQRLSRAAKEIVDATGRKPATTTTDLTKAVDVERLVANTFETFGGVYTLINNTGGPPAGAFTQFDDATWQKAYELTLLSYIRTTRAALPHMAAAGGGRIVNVTSSSVKAALDNLVLSNTFRMGVLGLSKSLAVEMGPRNILVNVVGPGRIETDRIVHLDKIRAEKAGKTPQDVQNEAAQQIAVGRYGKPEEFAKTCVFLGSPANTYVTGQSILVDGGMVRSY